MEISKLQKVEERHMKIFDTHPGDIIEISGLLYLRCYDCRQVTSEATNEFKEVQVVCLENGALCKYTENTDCGLLAKNVVIEYSPDDVKDKITRYSYE